jgi:hypothetical protein
MPDLDAAVMQHYQPVVDTSFKHSPMRDAATAGLGSGARGFGAPMEQSGSLSLVEVVTSSLIGFVVR